MSEVFEITESSLFMSVDIALASFLSSTTLPTKDFNSDTDPFTSMDVLCKVGDLSVEAVEFDEVVDEVAVEVSFEVVDGVVDEVAVEVSVPPLLPIEVLVLDVEL